MSAFIVSDNHINALVNVALFGPAGCSRDWYHIQYAGKPLTSAMANEVGGDLLKENYISVNYRYNEQGEAPAFRFDPTQRRVSAVEAFKAIDCYTYQACEHPTWEESNAYKFCESLRKALTSRIPGYDAAPWDIP